MPRSVLSYTNYFISGLAIIILGTIIMIGKIDLYMSVVELLVYAFLLLGISQLFTILLKKKKRSKDTFFSALINIVFAIVMVVFPSVPLSIIPLLFAFYLLFNSCVKAVNAYLLWRDKERFLKDFFLFLFFFLTGITFLFSPLLHLPTILSIIGFYCIVIGLGEWKQLVLEMIPTSSKRKMKRSIHFTLPVFLEAFLPRRLLTEINHYFNDIKENHDIVCEEKKESVTPDLEIFIHVAPQGFNQLGHMDIYFDGKVISYGNYDRPSYRMFDSIGDGVLFETNKEKYIPFCIKESNKTLIGFGLKLTDRQKASIRKELDKIKKDCYVWEPRAMQDKKIGIKRKRSEYEYVDYLYLDTGATFYKFSSGEFKTYFVLGANCTSFADRIVGKSGTDILKMVGIITPGTYLDYLDHEFLKKNSMVISKTIYNDVTKDKALKSSKKQQKKVARKK